MLQTSVLVTVVPCDAKNASRAAKMETLQCLFLSCIYAVHVSLLYSKVLKMQAC